MLLLIMLIMVLGRHKIAALRPKVDWTPCWRILEMMKTMTS